MLFVVVVVLFLVPGGYASQVLGTLQLQPSEVIVTLAFGSVEVCTI